MPRYTRAVPTAHASTTTIVKAVARTHRYVDAEQNSSAIAPQSTTVAAMCPDGKLDVLGSEPSFGTSGRGRPTMLLTVRNVSQLEPESDRDDQQCPPSPLHDEHDLDDERRSATTPIVSATRVRNPVRPSRNAVRWSAIQLVTSSSH